MNRTTNGYMRMGNFTLISKSRFIIAQMMGNPNFPTPTPNMSDLTTVTDGFAASVIDAMSRDQLKIAIRDKKKVELVNLLHRVGEYVLFASAGDREKMISSGISVNKEPVSKPAVTAPVDMQVLNGKNPGELDVFFSRVPGAISYQYQYATGPVTEDTVWQSVSSSLCKMTLTGLQRGVRYYVRIAVLGTGGQFVYSDPVSRVTQ